MSNKSGDSFQVNDKNANSNSETDARSLFGGMFTGRTASKYPVLPTSLEAEEYNMAHPNRGKCVIFNNRYFEPHTKLSERRGTDLDAENLYYRFRELGFEAVINPNMTRKEMLDELDRLGKQDYTDDDCFVCCILTHGDRDVLYATDGKFPVDNVMDPFRGDVCPSLLGKPKLFFIQACRGDRLDAGTPAVLDTSDSPGQIYRIPTHADFLAAYSTVPGFYSWRNTSQGSWFVQGLCSVLQERARSADLLSMLTVVCRRVALYYESCVPGDPGMDRKKQVPSITSTLTRLVYFGRRP
ncbi:caspase-1-like isoform X2 [Dermacentor albipictus]|uniref:caspase-1-like isoform X2 n=1 Tax=Dermacentor albipictus TaxID=60249 RepID=UPI0038FC7918